MRDMRLEGGLTVAGCVESSGLSTLTTSHECIPQAIVGTDVLCQVRATGLGLTDSSAGQVRHGSVAIHRVWSRSLIVAGKTAVFVTATRVHNLCQMALTSADCSKSSPCVHQRAQSWKS